METLPRAAALLMVEAESEADTERLLAAWRHSGRPVVHVQHLSRTPGSPYRTFRDGPDSAGAARPRAGEVVVQKETDSAFLDTGLGPLLRDRRIATLVVTGDLESESIAATLTMAGELGFHSYLVADGATGPLRAGIGGEGTTLAVTDEVLSAL
jgi:nicotinamidase-related amidase